MDAVAVDKFLAGVCMELAAQVQAATQTASPEVRRHFARPSELDRAIVRRLADIHQIRCVVVPAA